MNRRFLVCSARLAIASLALLGSWATLAGATRPNVVIVLVDDMGWSDIGCYGSEIPTPNIDALARDGLRFTQFYNTARCSPTRASLLTGLYPHQAGMGYLEGLVRAESLGTHGRLADRAVTVAEVLGDAGYFTAMAGKWHLGQNHRTPPWKRGFQRALNSPAGGIYFPDQKNNQGGKKLFLDGKPHAIDDPIFGKNWYSTQLFTDWSLRFVAEAREKKKPFFLYLAYCAPHFPLSAPAETIARFRGQYRSGWDKLREARHARQKEMGLVDPAWPLSPRPDDVRAWDSLSAKEQNRFDHMMAIYAAMIAEVDANVGRLVAALRALGDLDNTVILFLSDNGGNAESSPGGTTRGAPLGGPTSTVFLGMEWATLNNTPFRRYKHFTHEGGIATPLIVHWPAGIPAARRGRLVADPAHVVDVMPTLLELCGASYPEERAGHTILPEAGRSLAPAFAGAPIERPEPIFFAHEGNKGLRAGRWKVVQKHLGEWELYDLVADRTEQHDLATQRPQLVAEFANKWDAWAAGSFVDAWIGGPRTEWGKPVDANETGK
jgi:arylsulfatase